MKNDGKPLERTIQLIEETFKDSDNTQIFRNHKIKDNDGIKREFDVLIKTTVSGYEMYIAIECKDYGTKVSIDRIDGFKTKCDSIKEISKKIFVSKNGFQKGAEIKASSYGIELITAEEVSAEYLTELMPDISHLHIQIVPHSGHRISLGSNEAVDLEISKLSYANQVIEYSTFKTVKIYSLMQKAIKYFEPYVDGLIIKHYVKFKDTLEMNSTIPVTLGMDFLPQTFYFEDNDLKKIDLTRVEFDITVSLTNIISENSGRIIKNKDESVKAHSIKFKYNDNAESELILKPDNNFAFFHTDNKVTVEYKKLLEYNPETKKFIQF